MVETLLEKFVEVKLKNPEDFLKVRETLTRVGAYVHKENTLYATSYLLHKKGRYYIVHHVQMMALDGREVTVSEDNIARNNRIARLLADWGLVELVNPEKVESPLAPLSDIKIISHKDKNNYKLKATYQIGRKKEEI